MPLDTFVVAVISPDPTVCNAVASAMEEHSQAAAVWTVGDYPAPAQLTQIRDAAGGCVVLLDFSDSLRARAIAAELDRGYPMAAVIAIRTGQSDGDLLELMKLGIREVIALPMAGAELAGVCARTARALRRVSPEQKSGGSLYAFLPARPGSGATTIAAHSAAAAGRLSHQPALLVDFDLRLGMTSFLFRLHGEQSVLDALKYSGRLEDTLWDRMLCRRGALDILGSAPFEFGRELREDGAAAVLDYALARYPTICVDLPGEMRDHEIETIQRAREIFLVCTSDLGTLHMAKRKADFLRTLNVHSRVSVIMNRADARGSMPAKDVEELLQLPVRFTLPSAEKEIAEVTHRAAALEGRSPIAAQIEKIAQRMVSSAPAMENEAKSRRFIEFFSLTPVREKVGWNR